MSAQTKLGDIARRSGLELLVLFGSRAAGRQRPDSDWDLAYSSPDGARAIPSPDFDREGLLAEIVLGLGTDRVDLVDLHEASGLLRHTIASEGLLLHEGRPGLFLGFQIEAAQFWCDVQPVLEASYAAVLDTLGPR